MAVKEPAMQLKSLQKIMQILQDENTLTKLRQAQKAKEILVLMKQHFAFDK